MELLDPSRKAYVKPGNNHHIAIYKDANENYVEHLCTFWHAVERRKYGLPVVIRKPDEIWQKITENNTEYPEDFLAKLPEPGLQFVLEMQQNQMFVLGMDDDAFESALTMNDLRAISKHLYRVQKLSTLYYVFRHHLETSTNIGVVEKKLSKFILISSFTAMFNLKPKTVFVDHLGAIKVL